MTVEQADTIINLLTQVLQALALLDQWAAGLVAILGGVLFFVAVRALTGSVR